MSNRNTVIDHKTVWDVGDLAESFLSSADLENPLVIHDEVAQTSVLDSMTGPQLIEKRGQSA